MTKAIWTCRAFLLGYFLVLHFTADTYTFLILNVGLAYIPFEIAVFFPNAPYLLTDLLHLQRLEIYGAEGVLSTAPWLWRHFTYIIVGVFFGLFIGFWSFAKMLAEIRRRFNWTSLLSYQLLLIGLILLSSYAIYIGRFSRLHSIHLLTQPIDSLQIMFSVFHWPFWNFVFYFSIIQYVIYTLFSRFSSSLKN
ncbi:DUF1361 domain-containing protein [Listeria monocytogenes]|uniref:DUF1361 domain-containing protein n=1 Tax=Listeria monocytogenes TaxID=1639 RepID=UPI000D152D48|nr:DUF1361 domain-containing protein [Listeria monocytogenes]AVS32261.1 DUF1361 domain-containing protein [Listeria monocytogenes]